MKRPKIKQLIPNLVTLTGLSFGLSSIRFAFFEEFNIAVICVLIAGVCDVLDGLFSRILKAESDMGAELDSLSDFLSFGVAPGIILYFGLIDQEQMWGYIAITAYIIFSCIRLAIFNINLSTNALAEHRGYFMGIPTPAGAGLILSPLIHSFLGYDWGINNPLILNIYVVTIGVLLVLKIPTFSFKQIKGSINKKIYIRFFFAFVLLLMLMINFLWQFLSVFGMIYLLSIPISIFSYNKN